MNVNFICFIIKNDTVIFIVQNKIIIMVKKFF